MPLRDHLIAAGLALAVMALSLTVGATPDPDLPPDRADVAAADGR
jgi:hypothetical protein